ncbi:hypothetical protein [Paraburkholderia flava]|uniref:hypothetical protein n=1 Tax=Paraburkholderia flava TaxID=2547393 RepID=UPI001061B68F|nr:hypothetical protein [Paraburkholderia flava]
MHETRAGRVLFLPAIVMSGTASEPGYQWQPDSPLVWAEDRTESARFFEVDADWNRWTLSHHISFLLWVLSSNEIDDIVANSPDATERLQRVALCTNAYGSMLRYARLIGPENYARSVRPIMSQFYPGFSATWSADYQIYKRRILRLLKSPDPHAPGTVKKPFMDSLHDHLSTAKALVPKGPSLLRSIENAHGNEASASSLEHFVYDSLFLVNRTALSRGGLITQLRARVRTLSDDPLLEMDDASNDSILAAVGRALTALDQQPEPTA